MLRPGTKQKKPYKSTHTKILGYYPQGEGADFVHVLI